MYRRTGWIAAMIGAAALAAVAAPVRGSPTPLPLDDPSAPPLPLPPASPTPAPAPPHGAVVLTPESVKALSPEARAALRELVEIGQQVRDGQTVEAAERLRALLALPAYAELPGAARHLGYVLLANLDLRAGRIDEAQTTIVKATAMPGANAEDWRLQLNIALARHDTADAVQVLTTMALKFPGAVSALRDTAVLGLYAAARALPDGANLRFRLGQALLAAAWKPSGSFDDESSLVAEQAAGLIDRGDIAGARGVIGMVDEPVIMLGPRADKRFDPIIATDPTAFDLRARGERRLARIAAAAAASPGLMAGVEARAQSLIVFGHFAEALPLLDDALAKAQPADGSASPYIDAQAQLASAMALRARALAGLGRYDEAVDQLNRAASRPQAGHINVAQRVELVRLDLAMGRAKEALSNLEVLSPSDLSPEGRIAVESLRACAEQAAGDAAATKAALDFVRAHQADSPPALEDALACAGDMDGAARVLAELLADPDRRMAALASLQTLKLPPAPPGPHPNAEDRRQALLARPDVKAAIAKVGRIEEVPLYYSYF